ncbi:hypothetical protein BDZ89DRAFT_1035533 [Hymenopellis radicata]|nr:hypothetical protein BDZ89DRAFT_1035533 [Hymenopellis radicata]
MSSTFSRHHATLCPAAPQDGLCESEGWRIRCCSVCWRTACARQPHIIVLLRGPTQSQADLEQGFVGPWLGGGVVWSLTLTLWIVSCHGKPAALTTVLARRPTEVYSCPTACGVVCLCDYLRGGDDYLHEDTCQNTQHFIIHSVVDLDSRRRAMLLCAARTGFAKADAEGMNAAPSAGGQHRVVPTTEPKIWRWGVSGTSLCAALFKAPFSLTHVASPEDGPTQSQAVSDTASPSSTILTTFLPLLKILSVGSPVRHSAT